MPSSSHPLAKTCSVVVDDFLASKPRKPLIVVLGPTASGKTSFSIQLAHALEVMKLRPEIVNADSRQLYRGMDIGTAKITKREMEGIPHHLLSILDAREELTIARYQLLATKAIDDIHARGGLPILVGGSMLYISAIIDGLAPIATGDPAIRERLSRKYDNDGGITLHKKLEEVDPESALGIPRQNKVYLIRALEIFESTGAPKSAQKKHAQCPYDLLILGIDIPRDELVRRIDQRVKMMFESGWIEEVKLLLKRGYRVEDPGMGSMGYREILTLIPQPLPPSGEGAMLQHHDQRSPLPSGEGLGVRVVQELAETISSHVRAYAKRQRTWWRGDERIRWVSPD